MTPVKTTPPMFRINGCGIALYGERDRDVETGTYVSTLCICLIFVPVLCIRAYRVARANNGGWYFVGREPLSALAKLFNIGLLAAILGVVGMVQYGQYTRSPAYLAKRQMMLAQKSAADEKLGLAARTYQGVAMGNTSEAQNATVALNALLEGSCKQASLTQCAEVFTAAAVVARRGHGLSTVQVADKGLKLVDEKGDTDAPSGVAMLDAIRPLVVDTGPIDARRLTLLRKWVAGEPSNLEAIIPLASLLDEADQLPEAKKLLLPVKDRLGDGEGARVLGLILAHEGDFDGAYTLLWPNVQARLDRLHVAEKASRDTIQGIWDREIKALNRNEGPSGFKAKYDNASTNDQHAMVDEYVNAKIKDDPAFTSTQEALQKETGVVRDALELGMVMLQRAQGQSNPSVRKQQLEAAEKVFLAIGGFAGETDAYRLSLGQVYYWLGRQAEGRKLFDDYLTAKGRSAADLMQIGSRLRQLGAETEARTIAEEAYNKTAKAEEKYEAAQLRALCSNDLDDEIAWLNKGNPADLTSKAQLAKATGERAFQQGHDDEAVNQYKAAVDLYAGMPRTATTLNEMARAHSAIFRVTGDRASLERSVDYFQQAVDLDPSDSILLYNAGTTLVDGGLEDVIGKDLDLHALHRTGSLSLLGFLYNDHAGHETLAAKVKAHPGIVRGMSYLEKLMVVSPKHLRSYSMISGMHRFTHNLSALKGIEQRLRDADIDTSDQAADRKDFQAGTKDSKAQADYVAAIKRSEDQIARLRPIGGKTVTVAIDQLVNQMLSLDAYGGAVDAQRVLSLAEEAHRIAPSATTASMLVSVHLFHEMKSLRRTDPAFDAFCIKYGRSIGSSYLMTIAASEPNAFQSTVINDPEFKTVLTMMKAKFAAFPEGPDADEWALVSKADPRLAETAAAAIRKSPRRLTEQSISSLLSPASATEALDTYWLMKILDRPADATKAIKTATDAGMALPVQQ